MNACKVELPLADLVVVRVVTVLVNDHKIKKNLINQPFIIIVLINKLSLPVSFISSSK